MSKKSVFQLPMAKRMLISLGLGILFGLLCSYLAIRGSNGAAVWGDALMRSILFNRLVIGFVVALAGFIVIHPIFKFRMYPAFRGACVGVLVSLSMAFGAMSTGGEGVVSIFWATIIAGIVYGLIIDLVATKISGEGKDLLEGTQK